MSQQVAYSTARLWLLTVAFLLMVLAIMYRLIDLTVIDQSFLLKQGDARTLRVTRIPAYRGMIKDRMGVPLAVSTPVFAVWANPKKIDLDHAHLKQLAKLLDIKQEVLLKQLEQGHKSFVYVKRGVQPGIAKQIRALTIPGIHLLSEFKRFYPEGDVTAHVVGFTNIDDVGQEGMELAYNDWLQGIPGKQKIHQDRLGRVIQHVNEIRTPKDGHDLTLSIDRRLQYVAYRELKTATLEHRLRFGSVVIMHAKTGEVLAMANYPAFNPNQRQGVSLQQFRNRSVTDVFEPGSVMKVFPVIATLQLGYHQINDTIATSPGWMKLDGHLIRDLRDYGDMSLLEILQKSSNVGIAKIMQHIPVDEYLRFLQRMGFGQASQSGFPGEAHGLLARSTQWNMHAMATLGFGYSIAVSTLQLAQAYSALTGDGQIKPASLIKLDRVPATRPVLSPDVSAAVLAMLEQVVSAGTAQRAQVTGYRIAGKTGTARIAGAHGYHTDKHIASFVGIGPVSDPQVIVAVVLHEPKGEHYYGGRLAAPVFSHVMADTLRILKVPFDHPLYRKDRLVASTKP